MTVSGNPPYSWGYGTNLAGDFFYSQIFCEAMQALKNRADNVSVVIPNWNAYDADGNVLADLGQTPADAALRTAGAWRHVNTLIQMRTVLEAVVGSYYDGSGNQYTLASLLTAAVGRTDYNRTSGQLQALGHFDREDVEEILKAIDLLTSIVGIVYLSVDEDSRVWYRNPDSNYNEENLKVWYSSPLDYAYSLLKTSQSLPAGTIVSIELLIYCFAATSPALSICRAITSDWSEGSVTYNNHPSVDNMHHVSSDKISVGWHTFIVSGLPSFELSKGVILQWAGAGGNLDFYDRENGQQFALAPYFKVTHE
jgi:hypothetical protein